MQKDIAQKMSKYGVFPGPYFPVFEVNTELYGVNLRIKPKYGKLRTRKNSIFGHFSCSESHKVLSGIHAEASEEPCQTSMMECFAKIVSFKPVNIFGKCSSIKDTE